LSDLLLDGDLLSASAADSRDPHEVVHALETVLQAQWIALGFLCNHQFYKAVTLGETCVELVDALAKAWKAIDRGDLLFWRIICRANLGDSYVRFRKHEQAKSVLKQALDHAEANGPLSSAERTLTGTCYAHLSQIALEADDANEALRLMDLEIEVLEGYVWELSQAKEDREVEGIVLATAYLRRGTCDGRQGRQDSALAWLGRARECIEQHSDLSPDSKQMLSKIQEEVECAQHLQSLSAHVAKGSGE